MYGVGKFTGGLLSDSLSPRTMFTAGMLLTATINILIGFTGNVWLLTFLWSVNGLAQGCGWPPCTKLLREWFSPYELGTLWSLLTAGCNLASSISPVVTAFLTSNFGWSAAFITPGVSTAAMSVLAYYLICDSPSEMGLEEFTQRTTMKSRTENKTVENRKDYIITMLYSPFLWVLSIGYLLTLFVKTGVGEWTQLFLIQTIGRTQYDKGLNLVSVKQCSMQIVERAGSRLAHLYGLPKTHKENLSMRPILSATGTYNYALAKWLDDKLKPLSSNRYTISDTFSFADEIQNLVIDENDILVSYDVTSLFTNVPLQETIEIIAEKAFADNWFNTTHDLSITKPELVQLLEVATMNQLFQFDGNLYEQTDGVAMGSPLGPLMANAFLCSIEEKLDQDNKLPEFYRRYVDDTFAIVTSVPAAEDLLSTLNNCHPSIHFTMELASGNKLPFVGMEVLKKGCKLETSVYRKPTNTGLLLHHQSHVDKRYKKSLLKTMLNRAFRLSSTWESFKSECDHLKMMFTNLKYPDHLINSTISHFVTSVRSENPGVQAQLSVNENAVHRVVLPFKDQKSADAVKRQLSDLSNKIDHTLHPVFKSRKICEDLRVREPKPPIVSQQCVVYNYKCDLCDAEYVGYTSRHLHQRINEHRSVAMSFLEIGGLFGSITSGYITDKLMLKYGNSTLSSPRVPPMIGFAFLQLACVYLLHTAVTSSTSLWFISTLIFGIGFSLYTAINLYGVLAMENSPPGLSGTSHAIVALAANVGATLAGIPLTAISKVYDWGGVFVCLELSSLFCGCLLIGARNINRHIIDPSKLE
ncbi:Glucose-6-phosphate translocase [Stylophora pistillata]|uniref:Glucose-6-phosphate translocase n=1 Tax=Stylophora pistillata TaxID=50429 RepID=A0A2B4SYD3_STYPI|nr:Glucose-6-phosphate translocase [Stylophora pistillata]